MWQTDMLNSSAIITICSSIKCILRGFQRLFKDHSIDFWSLSKIKGEIFFREKRGKNIVQLDGYEI